MIRYRAHMNKIINQNLNTIFVTTIHTPTEFESILLKIKMEIMEAQIDVAFKQLMEGYLTHDKLQLIAKICYHRYLEDTNSLNIKSFFRKYRIFLLPYFLFGFSLFAWLVIDLFKGLTAFNPLIFLKLFGFIVFLNSISLFYKKYQKNNQIIFIRESEILRSKVFGLIYQDFNKVFNIGRENAS